MSEYSYDKAPTNPHHGGKMTPTDMVRYIEELETRLRSLLLEHISDLAQAQEAYEQVVELEANLAKAVEALDEAIYLLDPDDEDIAKETGLHRIVTTYKELTGGNDE